MPKHKHIAYVKQEFMCKICDYKVPSERGMKLHMKYTHFVDDSMRQDRNLFICDKCKKQLRDCKCR